MPERKRQSTLPRLRVPRSHSSSNDGSPEAVSAHLSKQQADPRVYSYDAYPFTVNAAGAYAITTAAATFDTYLGLYQGAFDPQNPLANALQYDDDPGLGTNALINRTLSTGFQYFALVTSYSAPGRGNYSLSIAGPGTATIATGAVPEPATWAMMILGMAATGFAMRRRIKISEANFTNKVRAIASS